MDALDAARGYAEAVEAGEIPASRSMRLAAARSLREIGGDDPAVAWDGEALEDVAAFVARLRLHDSENAPAVLHPWQLHLAGCLLARRWTDSGRLATRFLVWECGRGNAKSTTCAMLSLYLLATSPHRIEIWSLATKRDQAFRIVEGAGLFAKPLEIPDLAVRYNQIRHDGTGSYMRPLATRERTADGLNGRLYIADECGRYVDETMAKLWTALHKRPTAQLLAVTTPGQDRTNIYYRHRDRLESELRDRCIPAGSVILPYGIDEDDDPFDPAVWPKANPMLDVEVLDERRIAAVAEESRGGRRERSEFIREVCCRFDDAAGSFIDLELWDACRAEFDPAAIAGDRRVVIGLDLSKNHDLSAAVCAVLDDDGVAWYWGHAWTCSADLEERERLSRLPFRLWGESGDLTICDGPAIDLAVVRAWIDEVAARFNLWRVYVDPVSGSADTLEQWRGDGVPLVGHPQVTRWMSPPLQKVDTMTRTGTLRHNGWPVLRQCARNVRISIDFSGNPRAEKHRSDGLIDAFVACIMATTGMMEAAKHGTSVYERSSLI